MKTLGHPDHTYVLIYPGGHAGEFLCYWLGQHVGCVPPPTSFLSNNRYTIKFDQIKIHPRANTLKLFLPGHDQILYQAKNGFFATDPSRVIGVSVSTVYQKFYFLLFAIKTTWFKYNNSHVLENTSPEQYSKFLSVIQPRTEFFHDELIGWQLTQSVPNIDQILRSQFDQACIEDTRIEQFSVTGVKFCINLDQLFFGNLIERAGEYQRVCDHVGTVPDVELLHQLDQYHARNLDLVARTIKMSIPEFVALSNDQAWLVILEACHRLV